MHLIILTQYYPPEIGAPQARLSELAARFIKRGHRVTVITGMPNYPAGKIQPGYGGLWRRETRDGVGILRTFIYPTKSASFVLRMTNYLSFAFSSALFGSLLSPRADYIMVESPPLFLGLSGIWLSWLKRAQMIFNVSDLWPDSVVRLGKLAEGTWKHTLMVKLEEFCYRESWMVSGQSAGILADIRRRLPKKRQFHLSNGVDPLLFHPNHRSEAVRLEITAAKYTHLAIYAGLHGLAQGLEQFLSIAERLRDLKELLIVFVGDGAHKEELQARARTVGLDNVRFLPALPRSKMPALAASADIALVSLKIALPGAVPSKIYEAMGAGVPILLVAEGEPADIVRRTGSGLAVPMADPEEGAAALRRLVTEPELRASLAAAGRRAAETEYNRDIIANRFVDYLEKEALC